jgi:hypothetical protein
VWAKSGLQDDPDLLQRMQHTADVQCAFLMVLRGEEVLFPGDKPSRNSSGCAPSPGATTRPSATSSGTWRPPRSPAPCWSPGSPARPAW